MAKITMAGGWQEISFTDCKVGKNELFSDLEQHYMGDDDYLNDLRNKWFLVKIAYYQSQPAELRRATQLEF